MRRLRAAVVLERRSLLENAGKLGHVTNYFESLITPVNSVDGRIPSIFAFYE